MKPKNKNSFIIYCLFIMATIIVVTTFITSTTYVQLAIATLLYPPLIYFAFKGFSPKAAVSGSGAGKFVVSLKPTSQSNEYDTTAQNSTKYTGNKEGVELIDIDRRAFLKLIGAAGFSVFLFSTLSRKIEDIIFNKTIRSTTQTDPTTNMDIKGYKISEIDNDEFTYYGFVNLAGNWYVMKEDWATGSFRYARGESQFSQSWQNRKHLDYDYFHNVFN